MFISAEFSKEILTGLQSMGHEIHLVQNTSIINAVLKVKDNIEAVSDKRKAGSGSAWF